MTSFRRSFGALGRCILLFLASRISCSVGFVSQWRWCARAATFRLAAFNDNADLNARVEAFREEQSRAALVEALVQPPEEDSLMEICLLGRTELPTNSNSDNNKDAIPCLVLSPNKNPEEDGCSSLVVPITSQQLKILSFAYQSKPLSKSVLLTLNPLLVNRDDGLFDNLPWSTWTIDPQKRNRDAASNVVAPKFHLGKRDAYNRFMGKDWKGRSVSLGNMALRLKYMLEEQEDNDTIQSSFNEEDSSRVLAKRVLDLQIRELEMELAEWEYQVAVARNNVPDELPKLEESRDECQHRINKAKDTLSSLHQASSSSSSSSSFTENDTMTLSKVLNRVADMTTDHGRNAAPYRGAMGYAPLLDSKEDVQSSTLPYTSPFDLLQDIINDQLQAQVIGTILENTSLLDGTIVLGGAIVLRRDTPQKSMTIQGEELSVNDEDEDFGNEGVKGGETFLVECDGDEAIGMSLACNVPIRVEQSLFARSAMPTMPVVADTEGPSSVYDSIPRWELVGKDLSLLMEGQARNKTNREQTSPLFIPRTTTSLFDAVFDGSSGGSSVGMFPTDNPIQSLEEYDALSNAEKARTLTQMSNFQGKLARPRVLRQENGNGKNALDKLLLPLIDESVRWKYLIRDAERRGDKDTLQKLQSSKSRRQVAKEKAEEARNTGSDEVAEWWENEADLYEALRADVTQDEGSYSRFLDKDEWYERDRVARAKRLKKSSFGNLLDSIE